MTKKLLVFLACVGLISQVVSCTSNDSQSDSAVASDFDSADLEALDSDDMTDDSVAGSDDLPEDMLGESDTSVAESTEVQDSSMDLAMDDSMSEDPLAESTMEIVETDSNDTMMEVASSDTTYSDSSDTSVFESTPSESAPADSYSSYESSTSYADSSTTYVDSEPAKPANVPLQKMATTPWKQGGVWYNAIYFARPGDTLSSISKAIYGSDKTAMLKAGNPIFQRRGVKPGDKVYYNSPIRPDDSTRLITYYEDSGIAAESYTAQAGDNIRTVSKQLLGHNDAWKEIWSSNFDVESKGTLSESANLRYWPSGLGPAAAPSMSLAANDPMTNTNMEMAPPAMNEMEMAPPPMEDPMMGQAQMDMPPPPSDFGQQDMGHDMGHDMAMNDMPPPPPMDAMEEMAPPPPPMEMPDHSAEHVEEAEGLGNDQIMILAGLGAAVGLLGFLMIRNKRKKREQEMHDIDNTHVGT